MLTQPTGDSNVACHFAAIADRRHVNARHVLASVRMLKPWHPL